MTGKDLIAFIIDNHLEDYTIASYNNGYGDGLYFLEGEEDIVVDREFKIIKI
jgi:hypothetical protein